jgi:hypothetical protein
MKTAFLAACITLMAAGIAGAVPEATLTGSVDGTHWYVWASCTPGDSDGLSFALFKVSGVTEQEDAAVAPRVNNWGGKNANVVLGTYGFSLQYCTVLTSDTHGNPIDNTLEIIVAEDIAVAATKYAVRHFGQQTVTFTSGVLGVPGSSVVNEFPSTFLIACGTYDASTGVPGFTQKAGANVWNIGLNTVSLVQDPMYPDDWRRVIHYENVNAADQFLPEPATLSLLALGGAAALVRRRKAAK